MVKQAAGAVHVAGAQAAVGVLHHITGRATYLKVSSHGGAERVEGADLLVRHKHTSFELLTRPFDHTTRFFGFHVYQNTLGQAQGWAPAHSISHTAADLHRDLTRSPSQQRRADFAANRCNGDRRITCDSALHPFELHL